MAADANQIAIMKNADFSAVAFQMCLNQIRIGHFHIDLLQRLPKNKRAGTKRMRADRRNNNRTGTRLQNRTSGAHGIGRGPGWRCNNKSIAKIIDQVDLIIGHKNMGRFSDTAADYRVI